ncbi:MAG: DUF697 domain-containing protein [Deltaproteobacteria bacterium]|nr:DUF697 domain-containing protein [Deltaproteobacteria bacterium]
MGWLERLEEFRKKDWAGVSVLERETSAKDVIEICSFASGAAALVPVPLVDLALLLPVHTAMVMTVGRIYGRDLSNAEAARVVAELGTIAGVTVAGRAAISVLKGLLPGLGGMLAAPAAFAMTWGFGRAAMAYFEDPKLSRQHLKQVFDDAVAEGRRSFSRDAFDRFRRRNASANASEGDDAQADPKLDAVDERRDGPEESARGGSSSRDADLAGTGAEEARRRAEQVRPKKRTL